LGILTPVTAREGTPALLDADVDHICRTLSGYGVLSRDALCRQSGGDHWTAGRFDAALRKAVRNGRIVRLGEGLYELSDDERA
jgi:hypothetical protein